MIYNFKPIDVSDVLKQLETEYNNSIFKLLGEQVREHIEDTIIQCYREAIIKSNGRINGNNICK